jgi:hypothetical protein
MKSCQYCGVSNHPIAINCSKCAAPLPIVHDQAYAPYPFQPPQPQYPITQSSGKDWAKYFGIAFLVIGLFAGMFYVLGKVRPLSTPVNYKPSASVSESTTRRIKSTGGILLATSEENYSEMMRASVAGDDAYLMRMGIEGNQAGRAGWLPNEFIGD